MTKLQRTTATLFATVSALGGCASVLQANKRSPGVLSDNALRATLPAATQYGPDAKFTCATGGANEELTKGVAAAAKGPSSEASPAEDGRLCAYAETLLSWTAGQPPDAVQRYLSSYFGLDQNRAAVTVATLNTEDVAQVGHNLAASVMTFSATATQPRYGFASEHISGHAEREGVKGGQIKVVLVTQDMKVQIDPLPRELAAGARATLTGKLLGTLDHAKVFVSDPAGNLTSPPKDAQPGKSFQAEIVCGDKPGRIDVEIQAEENGSSHPVAVFPVGCGTPLPTSVALPPASATADPAAESKAIFDSINAERTAAGLPALTYDEAVAKAAQSAAEELRASAGSGKGVDIVGMLHQNGVTASENVLTNAAEALTASDAQDNFDATATAYSRLMSPTATSGGVGIAPGKTPDGRESAYLVELFVREVKQMDAPSALAALRSAIDQKRAEAGVPAVGRDATLDKVAQEYATALAATNGKLPKETDDAILAPLYKGFGNLNLVPAVKADPIELAQDPSMLGKGKLIGIGLAQGENATIGKNASYVMVIFGTPFASTSKAKKRKPKHR